jgi:cytochrome P450
VTATDLDDSAIDTAVPGFFLRPDYYELLARLRAEAPVYDTGNGIKLVSRYHDIREVSREPERFCSGRGVLVNDPIRQGGTITGSILHMDPPEHNEWRRILNRHFTARAVGSMEDRVRARTRTLLDAIPSGEVVDVVDVLSAPLPVMVIADLLGVPDDERSEFRRWSDATIVASDGRAALGDADAVALVELVAFLEELVRRKQRDPGDDVVSVLVHSDVGRALQPPDLVTFTMSLLVAGNETTRHLISGGLLTLAEHPGQRAALAADPALVPAAVEECLRWVTPIQQFARTVTRDTEVGGRPVRAGDYLVLLYASGNRDEAAFGPTAGVFDAQRPVTAANLAFGFGQHLCLGAALARLEMRVVLEEVLARYPGYEIAGDATWLPSSLVRGPHSLPLRFG